MKCEAIIIREYKRKKADSRRPELGDKKNVCGGDVTVCIVATGGSCHEAAELSIDSSCSRCSYPYAAVIDLLESQSLWSGSLDITHLLE